MRKLKDHHWDSVEADDHQVRKFVLELDSTRRRLDTDMGWPDRRSYNLTMSHLAQSILIGSRVLQIPVPKIEFFTEQDSSEGITFAKIKGTGKNLRLCIDAIYLLEIAELFRDNKQNQGTYNLWETVGEELYHIYESVHYPKTYFITQMSNEIGGDAYVNDRGEKAAKIFARQFGAYGLSRQRRRDVRY